MNSQGANKTSGLFATADNAVSYYDGSMNRLIKAVPTLRITTTIAGGIILVLSLIGASIDTGKKVSPDISSPVSAQFAEALKQGQLIYKTVDAQGRVSFGDQPGANAVEFVALERPSYQQNTSGEELQTRLDQMAATTKRLQEDRKLRSKLRHDEAEAKKSQYQAPVVVVENRVYRPRSYPYLYKPHHYRGDKSSVSHHSSSSLGLHLGGGSSKFHYGLSYGSHQRQREVKSIQTPYRREQGHIRSSGIIKRRQY